MSGLATGASWLCYYKALQMGDASKVVTIDKLSVVITLVLAFIVLHEEFNTKSVIGCILIGAGKLLMVLQHNFQFKGGDLEMYAQAIRTPPVYRHRRANNQAHLNMFKGCAFSNEPCDCIKSLKLGDPAAGSGNFLTEGCPAPNGAGRFFVRGRNCA